MVEAIARPEASSAGGETTAATWDSSHAGTVVDSSAPGDRPALKGRSAVLLVAGPLVWQV